MNWCEALLYFAAQRPITKSHSESPMHWSDRQPAHWQCVTAASAWSETVPRCIQTADIVAAVVVVIGTAVAAAEDINCRLVRWLIVQIELKQRGTLNEPRL